MFKWITWSALVAVLAFVPLAIIGCSNEGPLDPEADLVGDAAGITHTSAGYQGKMVIANRGSGTISVLAAGNGEVIGTHALPPGTNTPEPMYVVYVKRTRGVLVGDRANNRVVEFDADDFSVRRTVAAGNGVFHMWVDPVHNRQLWVNNDIDNTTSVIDPISFDVLATVPMPADLVAEGGKPHDVILDPQGNHAYVSLLGLAGPDDYVVKFDTATFAEVGRAAVGKDPHLSLTRRSKRLFVPCQNSNTVIVLNQRTMLPATEIAVPGAHGAGMTQSGRFLYTTNLTGGGTDGIYAIDTRNLSLAGEPVDTPYPVPHNLAASHSGRRLFLTHSGGSSDKVTFYAISASDPTPALLGEATVGLNPFGLAYVP